MNYIFNQDFFPLYLFKRMNISFVWAFFPFKMNFEFDCIPLLLVFVSMKILDLLKKIMTATSNENEKDLEKLFGIIGHVKFAMLTTVNEDGTLHSR